MSKIIRIFMSHSSTDAALVKELAKQIEMELDDVSIFASCRADAIPSGTDWQEKVISNLEAADVLVILITRQAENSMWVGFELGYFWKKTNKTGIFALYHPRASVPSPLNTLQAKLVTDPAEVTDFFVQLCTHVKHTFAGRADITCIAQVAATLTTASESALKALANEIMSNIAKIREFTKKDYRVADGGIFSANNKSMLDYFTCATEVFAGIQTQESLGSTDDDEGLHQRLYKVYRGFQDINDKADALKQAFRPVRASQFIDVVTSFNKDITPIGEELVQHLNR